MTPDQEAGVPIGGGWELQPCDPVSEDVARQADEYDGDTRNGRRREIRFVQHGERVAGVLYAREPRLAHHYAGCDHEN